MQLHLFHIWQEFLSPGQCLLKPAAPICDQNIASALCFIPLLTVSTWLSLVGFALQWDRAAGYLPRMPARSHYSLCFTLWFSTHLQKRELKQPLLHHPWQAPTQVPGMTNSSVKGPGIPEAVCFTVIYNPYFNYGKMCRARNLSWRCKLCVKSLLNLKVCLAAEAL